LDEDDVKELEPEDIYGDELTMEEFNAVEARDDRVLEEFNAVEARDDRVLEEFKEIEFQELA
jgi:hypothetical protein